ncbi:MAG: hypothetical protein JSS81_06615 [Acidobacteria bacterium]|nr:hypothetical protein [Acidobacteriota bacterium]
MFIKKIAIYGLVLAAACGLLAACGGQTDEANKFINEANAALDKSKPATEKADTMINELMGPNMVKAEDIEQYKTDNKAKFDEVAGLYEESGKGMSEAVAKFEQAGKLKIDDKFKEYVNLKAQEFRKRADRQKAMATYIKAFLAEKDAAKSDQMVGDNNTKDAAALKEANELGAKAEKIVKDNPSIFKN